MIFYFKASDKCLTVASVPSDKQDKEQTNMWNINILIQRHVYVGYVCILHIYLKVWEPPKEKKIFSTSTFRVFIWMFDSEPFSTSVFKVLGWTHLLLFEHRFQTSKAKWNPVVLCCEVFYANLLCIVSSWFTFLKWNLLNYHRKMSFAKSELGNAVSQLVLFLWSTVRSPTAVWK